MATMPFEFATRPPLYPTPNPPLLVLLHGLGADEHDLLGIADELDPSLHVVSLRAPHATPYGGYAWFPIDFLPDGRRIVEDQAAKRSCDALAEALPTLPTTLRVEPSRVILAGFSQGAMIAAGVVFSQPGLIDAAWLMSGMYLPSLNRNAAGKALPVLQQHGLYDEVLPVTAGRELADALRAHGHALQYTEYPFGHQIDLASIEEGRSWMGPQLGN